MEISTFQPYLTYQTSLLLTLLPLYTVCMQFVFTVDTDKWSVIITDNIASEAT